MPTPLLFYGDAPDCQSGLGRITCDLASWAARWPEFRVGTYGRGGVGSSRLPWAQYTFSELEQWGENKLEHVWNDFAGREKGIIFTIWDASRLFWFGAPKYVQNEGLRKFLTGEGFSGKAFKRWGYFPVDAAGPGERLSTLSAQAVAGYDRVLAYTQFGKEILGADDFIPHGIDQNVFQPRDRKAGRIALGLPTFVPLIGVVMQNQARKDWGLWAQIAALMPDVHWWLQVDVRERYWSLDALITDFGLADRVHFGDEGVDDETLSYYYSACDLTILPSLGEGFGYPIVESLACGIPVVHHSYAGGAEQIPSEMTQVVPTGYRLDTINNVYRPTFNAMQWKAAIETQLDQKDEWPVERCRAATEHLWWSNLAPVWREWFTKGL